MKFKQLRRAICIAGIAICLAVGIWQAPRYLRRLPGVPGPSTPIHLTRPYGLAPPAWRAYIAACSRARINPDRVTQTIGDFPASKGYHFKDGALRVDGEICDYTAAVDLHIGGMDHRKIDRLLDAMARAGFACWFRDWTGNQHIHAIYTGLPMKPQLRRQVRLFARTHRRDGWEPLRVARRGWIAPDPPNANRGRLTNLHDGKRGEKLGN